MSYHDVVAAPSGDAYVVSADRRRSGLGSGGAGDVVEIAAGLLDLAWTRPGPWEVRVSSRSARGRTKALLTEAYDDEDTATSRAEVLAEAIVAGDFGWLPQREDIP